MTVRDEEKKEEKETEHARKERDYKRRKREIETDREHVKREAQREGEGMDLIVCALCAQAHARCTGTR